jgi:hypothetical protein
MKQRGRNSNYPDEIQTWRKGERVPEWLSNVAAIVGIDDKKGSYILDTIPNSAGGFEIKESSGTNVLVRVAKVEDYVCYGDGKIFTLNPIQLNLLYNVI